MAYRDCALGMRVRIHPEQAREAILSAYRRVKGNTTKAAELLGVNRATLKRWVCRLELRDDIDQIRLDSDAA